MKTVFLTALCMLVPVALLAAPVGADSCDENVVIFSYVSGTNSALNSHAVVCIVGGNDTPSDTRFINPGSDRVSVRVTEDLGDVQLVAHVHGLGADTVVPLTRVQFATGDWVYDSPRVAISSTAIGSVTADVMMWNGQEFVPFTTTTYHTIDVPLP